jgi:pimeloyl-ACP methyl ester carboxylesterase
MPDGGARRFAHGEAALVRGEVTGEGPPILLCHGLTATRGSVVHGSRRLERAGYRLIVYDARGHGESDPAPPGQGYGYPELIDDLAVVIGAEVGEAPLVLGGHSMGAHTALGWALAHPRRVAGLVIAGPVYTEPTGREGLEYWDGLATALEREGVEGFVAAVGRGQETDPRWRDSVLRFTRERMERHRHPDAVAAALRQVPRSRPFASLEELESLDVPALVVASHDAADPGHPYAIAHEYAERLPLSRLVSEEEGQSPLAWQGGRLSREIEAFCRELQ